MEPLLIALVVTATSAELAPGETPRCVPACAIEEQCLETSTGWRCLSDRPPRTRAAASRAEEESGISVLLSAERLFGWGSQTAKATKPEEVETKASYFSVLRGAPFSVYATPRLAFDLKIPLGLTFGAAAGFVSTKTETMEPSTFGGTNRTETEELGVLLSARAGYHLDIGDHFAAWLRVGLSGYVTERSPSGAGASGLALTPEAAAIWRINRYAGLSLGFVFDVALSGGGDFGEVPIGDGGPPVETDVELSHSALTAGVVLAF